MLSLDDTIAAIASAAGGAARGIVRISGPAAIDIVAKCFSPAAEEPNLREIKSAFCLTGEIRSAAGFHLPVDLFVWPSARSYTRQPLVEIHTLGSPPLLEIVLQLLCDAGAKLAQPGQFTMRAFFAGRIDLMQAEAILGVIDAAGQRQLNVALAQLAGGMSRPLNRLRDELLNLLADLEAGLDFADEDIRFVESSELTSCLDSAAKELHALSRQLETRRTSDELPKVALVGPPNAGKSSLFNALKGEAAAIVSPIRGTTRDHLIAKIDAAGINIELVDTAGVEDSGSLGESIEAAAQQSAIEQHEQADLRLRCVDSTSAISKAEWNTLGDANSLIVLTKCDQPAHPSIAPHFGLRTSSKTGEGLGELRREIRRRLESQVAETGAVASTASRIKENISIAGNSLALAQSLAAGDAGEELVAAELRVALEELGKMVGAIYTDDLLDRIFSRFCIGK